MKIFNDFLRQVKGDLIGTRYSSFWECIVTGEGGEPWKLYLTLFVW